MVAVVSDRARASFAVAWRLGRGDLGLVSRWLGPGRGVVDRVARCSCRRCSEGQLQRESRGCSSTLFSRIQHAQRPECLELAPTAAAQWRLMDATENLRKNDSAKPWQRRDPGRNLHVGCAAQTVGPRRNCREHMALQPPR